MRMDLIKKINPYIVVKYLIDTGWTQYKRKNESIKVFQKNTDKNEFCQVTIPIDKTLADYNQAMFEAVEQIALSEGKTAEQLMLYLSGKAEKCSFLSNKSITPHPTSVGWVCSKEDKMEKSYEEEVAKLLEKSVSDISGVLEKAIVSELTESLKKSNTGKISGFTKEMEKYDKEIERGSYEISHRVNGGENYITGDIHTEIGSLNTCLLKKLLCQMNIALLQNQMILDALHNKDQK